MTKEKVVSLNKYVQDIKNRLTSPVPPKHSGHPDTYKRFLENELKSVISRLEAAKLEGTK